MNGRAAKWLDQYALPVCLIVQAALLFWRLDLLPIWGDEQFTLDAAAQPLGKIVEIARRDIHPPLYYFLVHYWIQLPWAADPIVRARAFSGLWALAATVLLRKLWFRDSRFLVLWALSPCLLLYGRMARSYTLQVFLSCLALYWGMRLIREPRRWGVLLLYAASGALLLYTHYLPALAILLAVSAFLFIQRAWTAFAAPIAIMILAYAPWLVSIVTALERVARAESHSVTRHPILEQVVRLLYVPVSFTLGETAPWWAILGGALLAPALAALLWRSTKNAPDWLPVVSLSAVIGYIGAGRWVSFAFIPARLLFVLPFYLALLARRAWICAALICLWIGSLYSYFHKEDFLNKGYLLPLDQIAATIRRDTAGRRANLIVDAPGVDLSPLTARLQPLPDSGPNPEIICLLRSREGRSAPPGVREIRRAEFVPYSPFDHWMMMMLDWPSQPSHVLELIEYCPQ